MNFDTINDGMTMAGGAGGALLANRYRIVRQLGAGGMGSVWLAEDIQLDGKLFAIKMLPSILVSNKRAYRQLKSEALVAMKLVHPNIVQIRAFEENNNNPFLVMDYIEGETLDDCLADRGRLSEEETIRILRPIAEALDYAHGEGVVHRDIKPANVMIRKDGHPYILDFGIAREIQETMTRVTGKLSSGTLLYMSPEQLNGDSPKPAQDVYSFAAMAYECLKGEPPFSRGQIEYQILNQLPSPLPSEISVSASIMAALAKKSENRPTNCCAVFGGGEVVGTIPTQALECGIQRRSEETLHNRPAGDAAEDVSSLIRIRAKIKIKLEEVESKIKQVYTYRGDGASITSHIDRADDVWKMVQAIETAPNSLREAEATLSVVADAALSISSELEWLKRNMMSREGAVALESEIEKELIPELVRYKADTAAQQLYAEGNSHRAEGELFFSSCDYIEAKAKLSKARDCLSSAVSISRDASTREHIGIAKQMATSGQWLSCRQECDLILSWDSSNADAMLIRSEALRNLVQRAKLRFLVDGEPLEDGATLKVNGVDCVTPITWDEYDIKKFAASGGGVFFSRHGGWYRGKIDAINGNWQGTMEFKIELREYVPANGDTMMLVLPGGEELELIYCAPGEFVMGSDDVRHCDGAFAHGQHTVRITRGFWLGKYPVTQKQWRSVMGLNPSKWHGDDLPVENVSWNACQSFIYRLNHAMLNPFLRECRFPTEAEWEYACRAGEEYCVEDGVDDCGWNCSNSGLKTHSVGMKRPNAWGFYDMIGNVWEWCCDWYGDYQNAVASDPTGPAFGSFRVLRGGSWNVFASSCRAFSRGRFPPQVASAVTGFRLCCDPISLQ